MKRLNQKARDKLHRLFHSIKYCCHVLIANKMNSLPSLLKA